MKLDLKAIEKRKPVPTIHPEFAYVTMALAERDILCQVVRAAKLYLECEHEQNWYETKTELKEALSKIEFEDDRNES
jgi:hypothetical protein